VRGAAALHCKLVAAGISANNVITAEAATADLGGSIKGLLVEARPATSAANE